MIKKKITNLFASIKCHNSKIFRKSQFYAQAQYHGIFFVEKRQEGITSHLLGNKGYPLFPWSHHIKMENYGDVLQQETHKG